jgi:UDP-N-acetylglucosamine:LPS N-acetylglucosamine transferase
MTSSLGSGHVRAAQAIHAAMLDQAPAASVETMDFWSLMDGGVASVIWDTYLRVVQDRSELHDRLYALDQRTWRHIFQSGDPLPGAVAEVIALFSSLYENRDRPEPQGNRFGSDHMLVRGLCAALIGHSTAGAGALVRPALTILAFTRLAQRLEARMRAFRPDVIVATQMLPAALLSFLKRRRALDTPSIGVLTDFGVHDFWIQPGIDRYCVAHESIAGLPHPGIDQRRVHVTGIPLMPGFRRLPSAEEARLELGLDRAAPVVLIPGGGLGIGVDAVAGRLAGASHTWQIVVVAGRNPAAQRALAPLVTRHRPRLRVWAWTERMELFVRAADVVVGKPGGLTVAEAMACGRPLAAAHALRGQEGFNVRFLEQHGVGGLVPEERLAAHIESLVSDPVRLAQIQQRSSELGRRDGAERIARLALELARSSLAQRAAAHR